MGALQANHSSSSMIKALVVLSVAAMAMAAPEAEAKADPYYGYYGLGHAYGYGGLYGGYGYGHYYGKRSAEAEAAPAAKADPYYGYYVLGHYGYAGYPYAYG